MFSRGNCKPVHTNVGNSVAHIIWGIKGLCKGDTLKDYPKTSSLPHLIDINARLKSKSLGVVYLWDFMHSTGEFPPTQVPQGKGGVPIQSGHLAQ